MSKITPDILGDVHFGRQFKLGVPLDRVGEREEIVYQEFKRRVENPQSKLFIQTGDLFNGYAEPEALVILVAETVEKAALDNPHVKYVFYNGNHDAVKELGRAGSFDVFERLLKHVSNVQIFRDPTILRVDDTAWGFVPWSPFSNAKELAQMLVATWQRVMGGVKLDGVFGHWDVEGYGQKEVANMIPTLELSEITTTVYTGHIHKPTKFYRDNTTVHVVGSMQPYTHAEGIDERWYITLTYDEYMALTEERKAALVNCNVRVQVVDGQVAEPFNCLSFITKKAKEIQDEDEGDIDVEIADFNMDSLFKVCLDNREVRSDIAEQILNKFSENRNVGN